MAVHAVRAVAKEGPDSDRSLVAVDVLLPILMNQRSFASTTDAANEVESLVVLPSGVRLQRATFAVAASPPEKTKIASVAQVRQGPDSSCVIDFGRMVTVGGLGLDGPGGNLTTVDRWTGASWQNIGEAPLDTLLETVTDRLLVQTTGLINVVAAVTARGWVWLPAQPTSLELVIDGTTSWFERQGSTPQPLSAQSDAKPQATEAGPGVAYGVDRTDALREAFSKASGDGDRQVAVRLRSATPGKLSLKADITLLYEHQVMFGAGASSTTIDAAEEGDYPLPLTGPFAATDRIAEVSLTLTGSFGPERVEPVSGPPRYPSADLVLSQGRAMLFGIPVPLAVKFGQLQALRLHVTSERGAEFGGRILAVGPNDEVGDAVKGGEIAPVQVPAGYSGWFTIAPPKPITVSFDESASVAAWLEVVPSYGDLACALTESTSPDAPGARILRRLPAGGTKTISKLQSASSSSPTSLYAAMRVVGLAGRRDPLPAVTLTVDTTDGRVDVDPTGDSQRVVLTLPTGLSVTDAQVPLTMRIATAGSVTAETVVVAYRKGTST